MANCVVQKRIQLGSKTKLFILGLFDEIFRTVHPQILTLHLKHVEIRLNIGLRVKKKEKPTKCGEATTFVYILYQLSLTFTIIGTLRQSKPSNLMRFIDRTRFGK